MNDTVESIYTQMFAPQPIPQAVIDLFDKTNFFASRIYAQQMTPAFLALLAAVATTGTVTFAPVKPTIPSQINTNEDVSETLQVQQAVTFVHDTPTQTAVETITGEQRPDAPPETTHGLTGPMDAPEGGTHRGIDEVALYKLSVPELKAHAKEFYGYEAPKQFGHKKIIPIIKAMKPIK